VTEEDVFQFYVYHVLHEPSTRAALLLGSLFLFGFSTYLFANHGILFALLFGAIIPRRAFASPESAATFLAAAQKWHAVARAQRSG
jgi:hypothetical protein